MRWILAVAKISPQWILTYPIFCVGESWPNYFGNEVNWWWILTLRISWRGEQRWRLEEGRFKVVFDGCINQPKFNHFSTMIFQLQSCLIFGWIVVEKLIFGWSLLHFQLIFQPNINVEYGWGKLRLNVEKLICAHRGKVIMSISQ